MIQRPPSPSPLPDTATKVFEGVLFSVYQWPQTLFDGSIATFEKVKRLDTVVVLALTPEGKVVINHEQQPGHKPFLSLPAGQIDNGEDPEVAARRELKEETGFEAAHLTLWMARFPFESIDWVVYTFIAHDCRKLGEKQADPGEKIVSEVIDWQQFLKIAGELGFRHPDISIAVLQAQIDPDKMKALLSICNLSNHA